MARGRVTRDDELIGGVRRAKRKESRLRRPLPGGSRAARLWTETVRRASLAAEGVIRCRRRLSR